MSGQLSSCFSLSVMADEDNVKDVLLTSPLMVSWYRVEHPLDTEDKGDVGLSSEDEAEGLGPEAEVAWKGQASRVRRAEGVAPTPVGEDEVLVKKRALRRVKHQVSSLLRGKDLPEGAEAHKVAEVPYQLSTVGRDATVCPVCERELPNHHKLMKHMGVHHGEKYPCSKCGKILASLHMLQAHQPACIQGKSIQCPDCGKQYASRQSMRQHHKVAHGVDRPEADEAFPCPHCQKNYNVHKSMREHSYVCSSNPARKGPFFCRVPDCVRVDHPFSWVKNLNAHMSGVHGWVERRV